MWMSSPIWPKRNGLCTMIDAGQILAAAREHGYDFMVGVPCSFMTPLINSAIATESMRYVGATSEGEAMAIAAGAWLAGRKTIVMMQNSGLGNAVNPLTSLNAPFRIPALLLVSWRGRPGIADEPQHHLMGAIMHGLLDQMRVAHGPLPSQIEGVEQAFATAENFMRQTSLPYAFIVNQGDFADAPAQGERAALRRQVGRAVSFERHGPQPSRVEVLRSFLAMEFDAAVVASTGKCGRELFTLDDRRQHLYQVGSMGCASAMGLGLALNTARRVVVLDGDGAALMKMGNMATIGAYAPPNLIHVVLDNGVHDSTGEQATVSSSVAFTDVAIACGYMLAVVCDDLDGWCEAYALARNVQGPVLIHVRITPGSLSPLARPTLAPDLVAARLRSYLSNIPGQAA
jgi:phosphonopyruvate decarboxylase